MRTTRIATLAALLAGASVGLAGPASAALVDGTYQETQDWNAGPKVLTVTITACGTGCKDLAGAATDVQQYHLEGNTWTCHDPKFGDVLTIDNDSLAGTWESKFLGIPVPLRLVKVG